MAAAASAAQTSELNVVIASDFVRDERFGSSKVPLRIAAELAPLGVRVTTLFSEDLPRLPHAKLTQLTSPFRIASALKARAADAHVVDIAGWDAWPYARWAHEHRPGQIVVSRSNGLWCRTRPERTHDERSAPRRAASAVVQAELCRWERTSIREADLVLFGASSDADYVVERGWNQRERIAVVSPGIDDFFASDVPLEQRAGVFYVGSYIPLKGGDVAADAFALALSHRPELTATFVGPGAPPELILSRFSPELRPRVRIVDKVPATQVARELRAGAVLLWPARYEGFGMVVLEAMRAGLVVVATRTGAGGEIVRDGENGLAVPFADVPAMAAAIERVVGDQDLRLRLARRAVEDARGRSWRVTASRLVEAYERARAARRPA